MAQNFIYSPAIPYVGSVPTVIAPGFVINIKGTTHPNCSRIGINLQCGPNICPRDDVVLHIGVDFIRGCVTRNSIHHNSWGPEETQQGHFPFIRGVPFLISITCEPTHFNIAINSQHFTSFEHRIVYHRASHLAIDGDVVLEHIEYRTAGMQVPPQSGLYPQMPGVSPAYTPSSATTPYPAAPGMPLPPGMHPQPSFPYGQTPTSPMVGPYSNSYPHPHAPHLGSSGVHSGSAGHGSRGGVVGGLLNKIGMGGVAATAATAGLGYLGGKKAWKGQKKARKKALKYGIPLAGAGLGAYALSKAWSSSSSSSSSDEE